MAADSDLLDSHFLAYRPRDTFSRLSGFYSSKAHLLVASPKRVPSVLFVQINKFLYKNECVLGFLRKTKFQ